MSIHGNINDQLTFLGLSPLVDEQLECLNDPSRLEEAAGMLADLRDRCGIRLPLPAGTLLAGPYTDVGEVLAEGRRRRSESPLVAVDRMATDESRSSGAGDEYYITGYRGADAAVALAMEDEWVAVWVAGEERASDT